MVQSIQRIRGLLTSENDWKKYFLPVKVNQKIIFGKTKLHFDAWRSYLSMIRLKVPEIKHVTLMEQDVRHRYEVSVYHAHFNERPLLGDQDICWKTREFTGINNPTAT